MRNLQSDEALLMADWKAQWRSKHPKYPWFNADGVVDHKRWSALPDGKHILTGGWGLTSNVLHDIICKETIPWTRPNEKTNLWYYETDAIAKHHKTLVVSMPHPNRSDKRWTLELENVLRITGRL